MTTPLRTGSPAVRSTWADSPVSTDSSRTAALLATWPSTGTTSPGFTSSRSPTRTWSTTTVSSASPAYRWANRGACSSKARRSWEARRCAAESKACPDANMTAISDPARYSCTTRVPPSDSTAMRSTPVRPRHSASAIHVSAGTIATAVPTTHAASAVLAAPTAQAMTPSSNAPVVTARSVGSSHGRKRRATFCQLGAERGSDMSGTPPTAGAGSGVMTKR